ncbi:MAG: asparagine synthase (glutamine-hydrolyzing) [Opitutaceae bacterium]
MCGIVAMLAQGDAPLDAAALDAGVNRLRHRGPDAQRSWLAADRRAGLGHARLSIIDLTTGDQPIANEDESLHLIANGEFYDYERIQRELTGRGHRLRTRSDSEVALHLYEERGSDCLRDLRGEFAFVIWDASRRTLFAARDRFGIKPLFYGIAGGVLRLASEAKALAAAGHPLRWDQESAFQNLFAGVAPDRTLFAGVRQVPAGHYLLATERGVQVRRYWDVDYPHANRPRLELSETAWIESLRARAEEAVRLRLRADVPVGCLLSGGLDSSAALGMARALSQGPLAAFTIAFDHAEFDESAVAAETAARANAAFHPIRVTNADFATHFADAVWHAESLHYNAHGTARYLLSRAVRAAGYKVVLAGEGADELGAGYHFCEKVLQSPPSSPLKWPRAALRLLRPYSPLERQIAGTSPWLVRASRLLGFPDAITEYVGAKIGAMRDLLAPDFAATFARRDPYREFFRQFDLRRQLLGREPVKQVLTLWLKSFFVNYVLAGERLDMAHGVELRLPFLDHPLFEFAREMPSTLFLREGRQKWVLREAMRPYVLDRVRLGQKQPFLAPPSTLEEGSALLALAQDTLRSRSMATVPFFDHHAVVRLLDTLPHLSSPDRAALDPVLLMLLSTAVLQDRFRLS